MKDARHSANKVMRNLDETYIHKPGDKIKSIEESGVIVESTDGTTTQMMTEEFVVKDIRHKILSAANNEELDEGFLAIAGAVAVGGVIAIGITKAAGAFKRWIQRRKKDKQYKEEQRSNARAGANYVDVDGEDSFTVHVTTGSKKNIKRPSVNRDTPVYRNGKKMTIDEFLQDFNRGGFIETILIHHKNDVTAVSLYSEQEIRSSFIEYEFTNGINRYYLLGEDDLRNTICFCPQDAGKLFVLDMESVSEISSIPNLKKFKMSLAGMEPGYAMDSLSELAWKEVTFYDESIGQDAVLMKA